MISITTYWKVSYLRHSTTRSRVFAGKPLPVYGTGKRTHKLYAYEGTSVLGEPAKLAADIPRPDFQIVELGELPPLRYQLNQKLKLQDKGGVVRHITDATWKDGGWHYWVEILDLDRLPADSTVHNGLLIKENGLHKRAHFL